MSFDIGGIGSTPWIAPANTGMSATPVSTAIDPVDSAVTVDMLPASPPPELSLAFAVASDALDRLHASGTHLQFALDSPTGKLSVNVQDLSGNTKSTITAGEALRIAGGESFN